MHKFHLKPAGRAAELKIGYLGGLFAAVALLLLLAGTANAFAVVRCVPTASLDPACSSSYPTIQSAVAASGSFDVVLVGPGTYNEQVSIMAPMHDISVLGAQAGNDARQDRSDSTKESIVNFATGAFIVTADRVIIDGFTVQGADKSHFAITVNGPSGVGDKLFNNIVQMNAQAVCGNSCGGGLATTGTSNLVIRRNLFRNENDGIFASNTIHAIVADNVFTGHLPASPSGNAAAINFNGTPSDPSSSITVSNNQADNNQTFIVVGPNTDSVEFSHNRGSHFSGTAVYVTGANDHLVISDNDLNQGAARGIKFNQDFGAGTIRHATVTYNSIQNMGTYGIFAQNPADTGSALPTLTTSAIVGNEVDNNGANSSGAGIFIDKGNTSNFLTQNDAHQNQKFDCQDNSTGPGTSGTGNVWFDNNGDTSSPTGICRSGNHRSGDGDGDDGHGDGHGDDGHGGDGHGDSHNN